MKYHLKKGLINKTFKTYSDLVNFCYQIQYPQWIKLAKKIDDDEEVKSQISKSDLEVFL